MGRSYQITGARRVLSNTAAGGGPNAFPCLSDGTALYPRPRYAREVHHTRQYERSGLARSLTPGRGRGPFPTPDLLKIVIPFSFRPSI
jgi:hypothetical protein